MKVKALKTLKNSCDEILFVKDREYTIIGTTKRSYIIPNEIHSETLVYKRRLSDSFDTVKSENEVK